VTTASPLGNANVEPAPPAEVVVPSALLKKAPIADGVVRAAFDDDVDVARWKSGTEGVRTTASWTIKTVGAIAAVVFGAGPLISRGELTGDNLGCRIGAIAFFGFVGSAGVVALVSYAAQVLAPRRTSLLTLSTGFQQHINDQYASYLPHTATTIDSFRTQRKAWLKAADDNDADVSRRTNELNELERRYLVDTQLLAVTAEADKKARELLTNSMSTLAAQIVKKRADLLLYQSAGFIRNNADVYERTKEVLLSQAEYEHTREVFARKRAPVAALAALLGAIGYVSVWSYKPPEPKVAATEAPFRFATLAKVQTAASVSLWNAAGLDNCSKETGKLDVVVRGGAGTAASPYVVEMLPRSGCQQMTFEVIGATGQLAFSDPKPFEIKYVQEKVVSPATDGAAGSTSSTVVG
jgi:hypothetical protein